MQMRNSISGLRCNRRLAQKHAWNWGRSEFRDTKRRSSRNTLSTSTNTFGPKLKPFAPATSVRARKRTRLRNRPFRKRALSPHSFLHPFRFCPHSFEQELRFAGCKATDATDVPAQAPPILCQRPPIWRTRPFSHEHARLHAQKTHWNVPLFLLCLSMQPDWGGELRHMSLRNCEFASSHNGTEALMAGRCLSAHELRNALDGRPTNFKVSAGLVFKRSMRCAGERAHVGARASGRTGSARRLPSSEPGARGHRTRGAFGAARCAQMAASKSGATHRVCARVAPSISWRIHMSAEKPIHFQFGRILFNAQSQSEPFNERATFIARRQGKRRLVAALHKRLGAIESQVEGAQLSRAAAHANGIANRLIRRDGRANKGLVVAHVARKASGALDCRGALASQWRASRVIKPADQWHRDASIWFA